MTNFYKVYTSDAEMSVCRQYLQMLNGGKLVSIPLGTCYGMLSNLGTIIIIQTIQLVGFSSKQVQSHATMFSIFVVLYINIAILPLLRFFNNS
jgi:hypothetical protein